MDNKEKRNLNIERIETQLIEWNNKRPLDKWWRVRYNIPFGSKKHREMKYKDIVYDYIEYKMYERLRKEREDELEKENDIDLNEIRSGEYENFMREQGMYVPKERIVEMSESEKDEFFESIDLDYGDDGGFDDFMKNKVIKNG